jgi:hypothetical protein
MILLLRKDLMECLSDAKKCAWDRAQPADDDEGAEILRKTCPFTIDSSKKGARFQQGTGVQFQFVRTKCLFDRSDAIRL